MAAAIRAAAVTRMAAIREAATRMSDLIAEETADRK